MGTYLRQLKKRKMYLALGLCFILCFTICFTAGCAGAGDWISEPLPGNFVVIRSNNDQVQLCIPDEDFTGGAPVVGPVITKVSCNEEYLLLKVKEPVDQIESFKDLKEIFKRSYYIVTIESKEDSGPLSKEDFEKALEENQISEVVWQDVHDLPKMEELK